MSDLEVCRNRLRRATSKPGWLGRLVGKKAASVKPAGYLGTEAMFDRLAARGLLVWGGIAQANNVLFTPGGDDSFATVVWSDDSVLGNDAERMRTITSSVAALKGTRPEAAELAEAAEGMTNELSNRPRIDLPSRLTGGFGAAMARTLVLRSCLPGGFLVEMLVPFLIDPNDARNNSVLPVEFWPPDLAARWRQKTGEHGGPAVPRTTTHLDMIAKAQAAADRGAFLRLTPSATRAIREKMADDMPRAVEVAVLSAGNNMFETTLNTVGTGAFCVVSFVRDGIRVHIPDDLSALFLDGAVVDFVDSGGVRGFRVDVPSAKNPAT